MFPPILDTGRLSGRGYVTLPRTDAAIFPLAVPSTEMRTRRELKDKFNLFSWKSTSNGCENLPKGVAGPSPKFALRGVFVFVPRVLLSEL